MISYSSLSGNSSGTSYSSLDAAVDHVSRRIMSRTTVREDTASWRALDHPLSVRWKDTPNECSLDKNGEWFKGWEDATHGSGISYVKPANDVGLAVIDKQVHFKEGYGFKNRIIVDTNLNNIGIRLSQAYELRTLYKQVRNTDVYHAFVKFLKSKGYNAPKSPEAFAAGYLESGYMAAVTLDGRIMYLNKNASREISRNAAFHGVSFYTQLFYAFLHETGHLAGVVGRNHVKVERKLEALLAEFFGKIAANEPESNTVNDSHFSSKRELYNELTKIAKERLKSVKQNYGGLSRLLNANGMNEQQAGYSKSDAGALTNALVSKYTVQAESMGLKGEHARNYVVHKVKEELAKKGYETGYEGESKGDKNDNSKERNNAKCKGNKNTKSKEPKKGAKSDKPIKGNNKESSKGAKGKK